VTTALATYGAALRQAAAGHPTELHLVDPAAAEPLRRLAPADWCGGLRPGDRGLLSRCAGPTLDVGCGPGRLAAALAAAGLPTLGVDICAEAVRQARRRGVPAQQTCVFSPLPGEGDWRHALLADGNIGIGGDPKHLLSRCQELIAPGGDILVEIEAPGTGSWQGQAVLRHHDRVSHPFPWATLAADDLPLVAEHAELAVVESWTEAERWFARVTPRRSVRSVAVAAPCL
jgi:SAM-dependent methyltransferase